MKTILITGAAKGIGRGIAREAAARGYNVVINYNTSETQAKELEAELQKVTGALALKADVSDYNQVDKMFCIAEKRFGKVTDIVNNAGVSWTGLLTDMQICQYDRLIDTNIKGVINVIKRALPNMLADKNGAIVNISSIWGKTGASCEAVYSATKAAVIGFTEAMSREVGLSGIRVNAVCPGVIDTDMLNNLSAEEKLDLCGDIACSRLGTPADIAKTVLFLLGDDAAYITGQSITVDGGFI